MYSIWLLPSEKESQRLQKIIDTLSESFKTSAFEPHITLYTNVATLTDELFYKISVLAALTDSFDVSISQLQSSSTYFKVLFAVIKDNENLEKFQQEINNLFPDSTYDFQPHLSLLYGEIAETSINPIIASVKEKLATVFQVTQIAIVYTQGDVRNWKIIETFDFHQTQNSHLDFVYDTVKHLKI